MDRKVLTPPRIPRLRRVDGWKGSAIWDDQDHDQYALAWEPESKTVFMAAENTVRACQTQKHEHKDKPIGGKPKPRSDKRNSRRNKFDISTLHPDFANEVFGIQMAVWNRHLAVRYTRHVENLRYPSFPDITLSSLSNGEVKHILPCSSLSDRISVPLGEDGESSSSASLWTIGRLGGRNNVFVEISPTGRIAQTFKLTPETTDAVSVRDVASKWIVTVARMTANAPVKLWSLDGGQFIHEKIISEIGISQVSCWGNLCAFKAYSGAGVNKTRIFVVDTKELLRGGSKATRGDGVPLLLDQTVPLRFYDIRNMLLTPNAVYLQCEVVPIGGALYSLPLSQDP